MRTRDWHDAAAETRMCCGLSATHPLLLSLALVAFICSGALIPSNSSTARARGVQILQGEPLDEPNIPARLRSGAHAHTSRRRHRQRRRSSSTQQSSGVNETKSAASEGGVGHGGRGGGSQAAGTRGTESPLAMKRHERRVRPPAADTVLRLKAVRSFFDELDRTESAATAAAGPANRTTGSKQSSKLYGLVLTRKFSGRMQTGCVGGCFR